MSLPERSYVVVVAAGWVDVPPHAAKVAAEDAIRPTVALVNAGIAVFAEDDATLELRNDIKESGIAFGQAIIEATDRQKQGPRG